MSVLRRNMFRGGGYAHRGTGITTGLNTPKRGYVDGPGSYAGVEDTKQKFEDYMNLFDEMGLSKEKKPFNKLAAASPALLALGSKLLSGKSYQGGWSGGLDILGQAAEAAVPLLLQLEQQVKATEMSLAQQYNEQLMTLNQHAAQHRRPWSSRRCSSPWSTSR